MVLILVVMDCLPADWIEVGDAPVGSVLILVVMDCLPAAFTNPQEGELQQVLILVVMDCPPAEKKSVTKNCWALGLNPCCNGLPSG